MTSEVTRLLAEIRAEAATKKAEVSGNPVAAAIEAIIQKHRTPEQIAAHREMYRQAKLHVERIDAWNAANNDQNARPYLPQMLAYLGAFSYVEKDT
jgi:molybdopterin converting factor small subunit